MFYCMFRCVPTVLYTWYSVGYNEIVLILSEAESFSNEELFKAKKVGAIEYTSTVTRTLQNSPQLSTYPRRLSTVGETYSLFRLRVCESHSRPSISKDSEVVQQLQKKAPESSFVYIERGRVQ